MNNKNSSKVLFLPVEIAKRELSQKIYLAMHAIMNDYLCIIYDQNEFHQISNLGIKGILLSKNLDLPNKINLKNFEHICCLHEEGLVYKSDDSYSRGLLKSSVFNWSIFFTWGIRQKNIITNLLNKKKSKLKVVNSGHPKFDLIFKDKTDFSNKKNFILVCSRYSWVNHPISSTYWLNRVLFAFKDKKEAESCLESQKISFESMKKLVRSLSTKYPEIKFIIRSHPSEDINKWGKDFNKNVYFDSSGNVEDWISKANAVIHEGCTTGIESFKLGTKTITLVPGGSNWYLTAPNTIGAKSSNYTEIEKLLLSDDYYKSKCQTLSDIKEFISNWDIPNSGDTIINSINKLDVSKEKNFKIFYKTIYFFLKISLRNIKNKLLLYFDKSQKTPIENVLKSYFSNIDKYEILNRIKSIKKKLIIQNPNKLIKT